MSRMKTITQLSPGTLYQYVECGLENIWIAGMNPCVDDAGQSVYSIPNLPGLHREIARVLVEETGGLSGQGLRFLRTELGLTQADLAPLLHTTSLTISRWERGENPIDENAMTVLRALVVEKLRLTNKVGIERLSQLSGQPGTYVVTIDGRDPQHYHAESKMAA